MFSTVGEGMSQAHGKHSSAHELLLVMNCTFRAQFIALTTKSQQANLYGKLRQNRAYTFPENSFCLALLEIELFLDKLYSVFLSPKYLDIGHLGWLIASNLFTKESLKYVCENCSFLVYKCCYVSQMGKYDHRKPCQITEVLKLQQIWT